MQDILQETWGPSEKYKLSWDKAMAWSTLPAPVDSQSRSWTRAGEPEVNPSESGSWGPRNKQLAQDPRAWARMGLRTQNPGPWHPQRGGEQAHSATLTSIPEDFFLWKPVLYTQ